MPLEPLIKPQVTRLIANPNSYLDWLWTNSTCLLLMGSWEEAKHCLKLAEAHSTSTDGQALIKTHIGFFQQLFSKPEDQCHFEWVKTIYRKQNAATFNKKKIHISTDNSHLSKAMRKSEDIYPKKPQLKLNPKRIPLYYSNS